MNPFRNLFISILLSLVPASLWAAEGQGSNEYDFAQVWALVRKSAPSLRGGRLELEAANIAKSRAGRHWYPRVYLTGRAFSSNDPGAVFLYNLGQRQIGSLDFAPSSLNQPGNHIFEQGTLGLDFPIYQGGLPTAQAKASEKLAEAKSWESRATELSEYVRVASNYATLLVLLEERKQLLKLRENVVGIIDRYNIGTKSNPVGYSGLLGLKTLRNRVDGLLAENEAKKSARRIEIASLASELPESWQPKATRTKDFLAKAFQGTHDTESGPPGGVAPAGVLAARAGAESLELAKNGERARLLPRVGLFAQGDLVAGARATGTSYTTGAYLQWDLFSAPSYGAASQMEHQAAAAQARADDLQIKSGSDHAASVAGLIASEKNLALLDESAGLLAEQTETARSLFRNGSINALQLVEVLSRRADLLVSRSEVELNLARLRSALFLTSSHEGVPNGVSP